MHESLNTCQSSEKANVGWTKKKSLNSVARVRANKPGAGPARVRVAATAPAKNINGGN